MKKIYRVYIEKYLKNPDKWEVRFIGWDSKGIQYAGCYKLKTK
jgi:hypothetical protein